VPWGSNELVEHVHYAVSILFQQGKLMHVGIRGLSMSADTTFGEITSLFRLFHQKQKNRGEGNIEKGKSKS
jgi:hypothetical protein